MNFSSNEIYETFRQLAERFDDDKKTARQARRQAKKNAIAQRRLDRRPQVSKAFELVCYVSSRKIQQYWEFITQDTDIYQRAAGAVETIFSRYDFGFKVSNSTNKQNVLKKFLDDPLYKVAVRQFLLEIMVDVYLFSYTVVRFPIDTVEWMEDASLSNLTKQHRPDASDVGQMDILNDKTLPRDLLSNTALSLPFGRVPIYTGDYYHHVNKNSGVQVYSFSPRLPEATVLKEKFRTVVFVRPNTRPQMGDVATGLLLCYESWVRYFNARTLYQGAVIQIQRPLVLMEERMTKNDTQQNLAAEIAPYLASLLPREKETRQGRNRQAIQIRHKLASPDAASIMKEYLIDSHAADATGGTGRPSNGQITATIKDSLAMHTQKTRPDALVEVCPRVLRRMEYDVNDVNKTQALEFTQNMASVPIGFDVHSYHAPQPQENAVRLFYELYERDVKHLFSGLDLAAGELVTRESRLPGDRSGIKNLRLAKIEERERDLRVLRTTKDYFAQVYSESGAELDQLDLMETMGKIHDLLSAGKLIEIARDYIADEAETNSVDAESLLRELLDWKSRNPQEKKKTTSSSLLDMTVAYYNNFSAIKKNIALFHRILGTLQRALLTPSNRLELTATPNQTEQRLLEELAEMDGQKNNDQSGRDESKNEKGNDDLLEFLHALSDAQKATGNDTLAAPLRKYEEKRKQKAALANTSTATATASADSIL